MVFHLEKDSKELKGSIRLDGSKSISNRALIIRALCPSPFKIENLSTSQDTAALDHLLQGDCDIYNTGPAGTTFRFLTAYLSLQEGEQILTGSARMKQRPIGPLVDALRQVGAKISYLEKEGYPPLKIGTSKIPGEKQELNVPASFSSQFISALAMIGPCLPHGLIINMEGDMVSLSYLEMTLAMMRQFGIPVVFKDRRIVIPSGAYQSQTFSVEADWSAASYYFSMAALADRVDLVLFGLSPNSWQGDSILGSLYQKLGIQSRWEGHELHLSKGKRMGTALEYDFILCPDIAQTVAVTCAGLGIRGVFTGLETLSIKETDRITALHAELEKVGVQFLPIPQQFGDPSAKQFFAIEEKANWSDPVLFDTYHDHRMAMSFAPLSLLGPIRIDDPEVVKKSYPGFWKDLISLGWKISVL